MMKKSFLLDFNSDYIFFLTLKLNNITICYIYIYQHYTFIKSHKFLLIR